ncbi:unnamed protein product [Lactuca saligna]|uniref:Tower domain-containing protein n=1 Tax=Lactuca saligna TaxID=75948 RepID=A0AA35Z7G6_LACSI|nr:unnamed protein product [Lactuca saligna]
MSTWQIFSDGGNTFRWQCSHVKLSSEPQKALIQKPSSPHHLPSIADLLVQGFSKLYEDQNDEIETPPFQTGLRKPVVVKQSSLVKASSILGDHDDDVTVLPKSNQSGEIETPPNFRTGSGKPVTVKQPSVVKASSILGEQEDGATVLSKSGYSKLYKNKSDEVETPPSFRTGLGKPVVVKQSSLVQASAILGEQDDGATAGYSKLHENQSGEIETPPTFRTGLGKPVVVKQSSLVKASSILGDEDDRGTFPFKSGYSKLHENQNSEIETPPTFRTGLGNPVVIKQSSLVKASTIFGDEDDGAIVSSKSGYSKLHGNQSDEVKTPPSFLTGFGKPVVVKQSSSLKTSYILGDQNGGASALSKSGYSNPYGNQSDEVETPPAFRTGLGKLVAVKQSSLVKASSILGDQDDGATADTGSVNQEENSKIGGTPFTFRTGSGKSVAIKQSSMAKALSMFGCHDDDAFVDTGRDDVTGCSNSMFQTGSGKAVNICSTGLIKARTLLGLEENSDHNEVSKGLEHANAGEIREVAILSSSRPPLIKFQTAGGRSVKVSGDALKRARSLLGDPDVGNFLKEGDACYPAFSSNKKLGNNMLNKENNVCNSFNDGMPKAKQKSNNFISPVESVLSVKKTVSRLENIGLRSNLIKEFDAAEHDITTKEYNNHTPMVDISNTIGLNGTGEKRKPSSRIYPSPFKKPRNSKFVPPLNKKSTFIPPLNKNSTAVSNGTMPNMPEGSCFKKRVSTRYPFQFPRKYIKEYFGEPPSFHNMFENIPEWLRKINPENADKHMFEDECGLKCIGVDTFCQMLTQSGCSALSKEWIANHYRWIIWKLACYERCYPAKFSGKLLTVSNVVEELKYRYEREYNNGHRSALKRILEGDAPPSSHLVLCIASVKLKCNEEQDADVPSTSNIELTDGWYSVKGVLDDLLLKQLLAGKLFVGQKLRICGAGLSGWNAPVSPLEASSMISLCLHMNGTYKAHWAERLGFCKSGCVPLSLKCIKGSGGVVPSTLVGVTRIYPVLYRERLSEGGFVVRSERMESKRMQLYDYRRSSIVEGVMSEFERGSKSFETDDDDEGERISHLLEKAAEPEVLMAGMTSEQLTSFASYQAKIEASRQSEMEKSIKKALDEAGLSRNEVNTLMRVRVVGLTGKIHNHIASPQQALITIWNPTEKQKSELVEGQAYTVSGLTPINSDSCTIYLRASGSTNKWHPLSPSSTQHFLPFFSPRKPILLSEMGEVAISSEFDVAGLVVYVGEVHKFGDEKRQWVFVTDGTTTSISPQHDFSLSDSLLAISFFSPSVDCDSIVPINYNLVGSTVGFCNLIKRAKDQMNRIWVAEATENSTYFLSYDGGNSKHLKDAAASADRWAKAKASTLIIEKLKGKISSMVARKV